MSNIEIIESFLNHNDPIARRQVIEDLTAIDLQNSNLVSILIDLLDDEDTGVKDSVARLLSSITDKTAIDVTKQLIHNVLSNDIELRNLSSEILKNTGKYCPEVFIDLFNNKDNLTKQFASNIVSEMKAEILKPYLLNLLNDTNENVRSSAIEALGNYQDSELLNILIERFDFENDLKPIIIESLGKIKNKKSEKFIISTFTNSEDIFLKITCLDSLSHFSSDLSLAEDLYQNISNYPESIHTLLIKTIFSIFERNKINKVIKPELRQLSRQALNEDDDEINYYGLISLGNIYLEEDIENLVYLVFRDNSNTQQILIENLIFYNNESIIRLFFNNYYDNLYKASCENNLLTYIPLLLKESSDKIDKLKEFQNIILEIIISRDINIDNVVSDIIESIDKENFNKRINKKNK